VRLPGLDLDTWQEVGEALLGSPLRTFLSMAGVFWGTFVLVVMLGFSKGLEGATEKAFRGMATNAVFVWGGRRSVPHEGFAAGQSVQLDEADIPTLRALPGVKWLAPRNQLGGHRGANVVRRGPVAGSFSVQGDVPDMARIETNVLLSGRNLDELDLRDLRKVAVVGRQVAAALFPDGSDPLGQTIEVNRVPFRVVGVYRSRRQDDEGDRAEQAVHVPFSTFQRAFGGASTTVQWIAFVGEDAVSASDLEDAIKTHLAARHHVSPLDDQAFGAFNAEREFGRVRRIFTGIRGVTWLVGTATLLSGAIGIGNVMLIAVRERTREIGIRRAIGATPSDVVWMIVRETLVLTALAGLSGLIVGAALCELAAAALGPDNPQFGPPHVDPRAVLVAAALLFLSGLVAAVLPARRAAAVLPVEALRGE
jgi:putative ABC transport system permease protein